jgi:hypothetical protein
MITSELQSIIAAEVSKQLRASRMGDGAASTRVDPYNIPFLNDSGETIPPYAVMRPSTITFKRGNWHLTMVKPDTTFARRYYVNGPFAIPDAGFGRCSDGTYPTLARFPGTGTLVDFRTNFGVAVDSWNLKKGGVGRFRWCGGGNYSQGNLDPKAVSLFQQYDCEALILQATAAVTPNDLATFNICDTSGETTMQITAWCMIYPPGIGGDGSPGGYTVTWPDDTRFGAHFYGINSTNHAHDWRCAWGDSPGTLI